MFFSTIFALTGKTDNMKRITNLLPVLAISFAVLQGCTGTAIVAGDNTNPASAPHTTGGGSAVQATSGQASATQSTMPAGTSKDTKTGNFSNAHKASVE